MNFRAVKDPEILRKNEKFRWEIAQFPHYIDQGSRRRVGLVDIPASKVCSQFFQILEDSLSAVSNPTSASKHSFWIWNSSLKIYKICSRLHNYTSDSNLCTFGIRRRNHEKHFWQSNFCTAANSIIEKHIYHMAKSAIGTLVRFHQTFFSKSAKTVKLAKFWNLWLS